MQTGQAGISLAGWTLQPPAFPSGMAFHVVGMWHATLSFTLEAFSGARSFAGWATEVRWTDSALLGTSWPPIFHQFPLS